jgi:hypothetical protein
MCDTFSPTDLRHAGGPRQIRTLLQSPGDAEDVSANLVALEPQKPVETVAVDDLPIRCAPGSLLQVVDDLSTFREAKEPLAQSGGCGGTEQRQHHAFTPKWWLFTGHVCGEERDRSPEQVAVRDGIGRTVGPG